MSVQIDSRTILQTTALAIVVTLAGCADLSSTPRYDSQFGDAVRAAKRTQQLNPYASVSKDPVLGLDGVSAVNAIGRYQCPEAAATQPALTINLGSSLGK